MTVEVLPCCCAVSPCPCFQTSGGYRVTWTGIIRHDPVGCDCFQRFIDPGYSGPAVEVYTIRSSFTSGVSSRDLLWVQPTQANPAPCFFSPGLVVYGPAIPSDYFQVGLGGYCVGPYALPPEFYGSFSCGFTLFPYRPSIGQKWKVLVSVRPFLLTFQSDSTNCDPTGFYLTNSEVLGLTDPESTSCHQNAFSIGYVASTLLSEGTVTLTRI